MQQYPQVPHPKNRLRPCSLPAALCLTVSLLLANTGFSSPLYQGYHHRVLGHVKTVPADNLPERDATVTARTEKVYGPDSIQGTTRNEAAADSLAGKPATAAGASNDLFNAPKDYGIRENLKP